MIELRRLDAVREDSKRNVIEMKTVLDPAGVASSTRPCGQASGPCCSTAPRTFTLRDLRAADQQTITGEWPLASPA